MPTLVLKSRCTLRIEFVPLLQRQQALQGIPRGLSRFQAYIRMATNVDGNGVPIAPLGLVNPMAKDHVTTLLDDLLALDADGAAADAVARTAAPLPDVPSIEKIGLIIIDDAMGGWTNRAATELYLRFGSEAMSKFGWLCGALWSSEPASAESARQAVRTSIYRAVYLAEHGPARTLRERMAQEGHVVLRAECPAVVLDPEDLAYSREVIEPFLDESDMRSSIECLFGDAAARSLGFTPRGLSAGAGLALAFHDAQLKNRGVPVPFV